MELESSKPKALVSGLPDLVVLEITASNIREGCKESGNFCPIALSATLRMKLRFVSVNRVRINVKDRHGNLATYLVPQVARDFIDYFDLSSDGVLYKSVELKPFFFCAVRKDGPYDWRPRSE
jgi:hypothetical protein